MHITLDEQKLLDSAHRVKDFMAKKGITQNGKPIGMALCRAMLTEGLLSRTYEALKETGALSDNATPATETEAPKVFLFWYGAEAVLARVTSCDDKRLPTFSLEYVRCQGAGTDLEIGIDALRYEGNEMAKALNSTLFECNLPEVCGDAWEYEDVLRLAADMGYGQPTPRLLDVLAAHEGKQFIDGRESPYSIDGDWMDSIVGTAEEAADELEEQGDDRDGPDSYPARWRAIQRHIVWHAECREEHELYEYYFTLAQLCQATTDDGGKTWHIPAVTTDDKAAMLVLYS